MLIAGLVCTAAPFTASLRAGDPPAASLVFTSDDAVVKEARELLDAGKFEKAEQLRSGAFKALDAKALKLTGGPNSPPPPADRSIYGVMIAEHKADIFLTYCTNALQAVREVPGARMIALPEALAVGADYGLTTMKSAPPGAERLAAFILSPQAQSILARHGFASGGTP